MRSGGRIVAGDGSKESGDLLLPGGNRIPSDEIEELASRSSGPGGQHVNTSSTRVTLRWNLHMTRGLHADARARAEARLRPKLSREGLLIVHAGRHRSRIRNRVLARERLQELVAASRPVAVGDPARTIEALAFSGRTLRSNLGFA